MNKPCEPNSKVTDQILDWYDHHARVLAWRIGPGLTDRGPLPDPYHVWLSEIMLQQTQVKTVHDYYLKFLRTWPSLEDLAAVQLEPVLKAWAGLGYYSRARNLKKCAEMICSDYDGKFPSDQNELQKLPGIGEYTSAAIAAIAFGKSVAVVDGNVERVMARMHAIETPLLKAKAQIKDLTRLLVPKKRSGDFAQAMMDLGATICTPKNPSCDFCPWNNNCRALDENRPTDFPVKLKQKEKPVRSGAAFVAMTRRGEIYLRKRGDSGMLAEMSEVPSTRWSVNQNGETEISAAPFKGDWKYSGDIRHTFSHFHLELKIYHCLLDRPVTVLVENNDPACCQQNGWWVAREDVMQEALPNLMKKALALVFEKTREKAK